MTANERKTFIENMYEDVFKTGNVDKVPLFFAADYQQETNYDILDHAEFVEHITDLSNGPSVNFNLEFLLITDRDVVVRSIVTGENQIAGAPPVALLISIWSFNAQGLVNYCREVADG